MNFDVILNKKILLIGDIMLDSYIKGDVNRISPEAPVMILNKKSENFKLGGAGNVALNLKSLKGNPFIISSIGNDEAGKTIQNELLNNKINNYLIITNKPTTEKKRIISGNNHLLRIDTEDINYISKEVELEIISIFEKEIYNSSVVLISDYNKGILTDFLIKELIKISKNNNVPIIVDPKNKNFFSYKEVDVFKPNLKEISDAFKNENDDNYENMCKVLKSHIKAKNIMLTLSEKGIYWLNDFKKLSIDGIEVELADTCGCGDTVLAVLAMFYNEISDEDLIKLCNLAGSMVCEHLGVIQIKLEDLKNKYLNNFENSEILTTFIK